MASQPPRQPPPASPPPGGKQALLDAFDNVLRAQAQTAAEAAEARRAVARRRRRRQVLLWIAVFVLVGGNMWIWQARPTLLFAPPAPGESVEMKEASLRIGMASIARKVELFRSSRGRLPNSLQEADATLEGVRYRRIGERAYELTGVNGPVALTLSSNDSLATFIGNSFRLIARRAGR